MPKAWESAGTFCRTLRCELLESSISQATDYAGPSGSISMRVAPEDFGKLLEHLRTLGSIVQHTTRSEDKTAEVIDVEARLKNLTGFRDSLRAMQGKPAAVRDLIEIQRQLADVQAQLDSEATKRKCWRTRRRRSR